MEDKSTGLKLNKLRTLFAKEEICGQKLEAVIVPSSDAHQSEYLADCDKRRQYISGFTGSAGIAVITTDKAALWTDGRYFLQAEKELDDNWTLMKAGNKGTPEIEEWLKQVLPPNSYVGCNPSMYSSGSWSGLADALEGYGHVLFPVKSDLIDMIWTDQPAQPKSELMLVKADIAGMPTSSKVDQLRAKMKSRDVEWLVVTALDDVAWLFNMRGSDIQYNPVFFSYAVVGISSVHLFIKPSRITTQVRGHIGPSTTIHKYTDIYTFLETVCAKEMTWIGRNSSQAIMSSIPKENRVTTIDNPVAAMKAIKNSTEIEAMKRCNITDAIALCRFFQWMEKQVPTGKVTECSAADKALQFRSEGPEFVSLSFDTISSSGPTGSIIHYKPKRDDDKPVLENQIYLIDSGAQYKSGTTDTTRTVHFGQPTAYEKECFTRVLKGHISLAGAVFPEGTKGHMLDALARTSLWKAGLDYQHGTGHGVGSFLNVHEGPVGLYIGMSSRITKVAEDCGLSDGIFITNEPGYYEDGCFGIRIENLMLSVPVDTPYHFNKKKFFGFETVALVPIQRKMIDKNLLTQEEVAWVNNYHSTCRKVIGGELRSRGFVETYDWLLEQTQPI